MLVSDWHCSCLVLGWTGCVWCWCFQWLAGLMLWVMLLAMWLLLLVIWTWFFMWKLLLLLCSGTGGMSESIFYPPGHEYSDKEEVICLVSPFQAFLSSPLPSFIIYLTGYPSCLWGNIKDRKLYWPLPFSIMIPDILSMGILIMQFIMSLTETSQWYMVYIIA